MGLKQQIEDVYNRRSLTKCFPDWKYDKYANNYKEVLQNYKKLKEDLCKFADRFDRFFATDTKKLDDKSFADMYNDITKNFLGKISRDCDSYFSYVANEGETLLDAGKRLEFEYEKERRKFINCCKRLKTDFKLSENWVEFFDKKGNEFSECMLDFNNPTKSSFLALRLTGIICGFIALVFDKIAQELEGKTIKIIRKAVDDKKYFYDETDYDGFMRLIRKLNPDAWSSQVQDIYDKHTIESVPEGVKIFPTPNSPTPHEVKQAGVGDCYLMAALIALAKSKPQAIKDCFVQGLDKIENEENITIRLFYIDVNLWAVRPIAITVNKKKVIMPQYIKNGALWPKLIEKAYAIYRAKGYEKKHKTLTSGDAKAILFAITGEKSKTRLCKDGKEKFATANVIETIENKLKNGNVLTCAFKKAFTINDVKSDEKIEIYNKHAYAIVGVNKSSKKYVRLIEPNKVKGRSIQNSPKSKEGGHIAMGFNDFKNNFSSISYTTGKQYQSR